MEDFLAKKIYDLIQNVYSEKNAFDLINEEIMLKQSNSDNKIKKKKNKKHENKRKRSGSAHKINQNKHQEGFLNKHNSLDEKKSIIGNLQNENSSEEVEHIDIKRKDKQEKFNSSDENTNRLKYKNHKNKNYNNNIINNINNESTEEHNSSNNENTNKKHDNNEVSSSESPTADKTETDNRIKSSVSNAEKDTILTVNYQANNNLESEYGSCLNSFGVQGKINNANGNNQVTNKMSWRKMTKGILKYKIIIKIFNAAEIY